jgi:thiosulfate dehydrogenase [quinone] large subunit
MATTHRPVHETGPVVVETDVVTSSAARKALAVLRIAFGLTFLWAFFDKLLALGWHTGWVTAEDGTETLDRFGAAAWVNGGSPTEGFLKYGVSESNWLHGFYNAIGGTWYADWLFMLGLLGLGLALTFGFGMRIAMVTGALLYFLMWTASFRLENNPVLDEHVLGAASLVVLGLTLAGDTWGVGKRWARTQLVRDNSWLR